MSALVLTCVGLLIMFMTLQPFNAPEETAEPISGGNLINQVGYLLLGGVYIAAMSVMTPTPLRRALLSPAWLIVLLIMVLSSAFAQDPAAAFRGIFLTALALIIVAGVLVLPANEQDFATALSVAALALLALVYAVVLIAPSLAIHSSAGVESWHSGLWKAHLPHKNFAAPVFSMILMAGIYCWWAGLKPQGAIIIVLSGIIVLNAGSKTTLGFLPIAIGLVLCGRLTRQPSLTVAIHALILLALGVLTVGTVLSPPIREFVGGLTDDVSFTGRDEIWRFSLEHLAKMPTLGHGYSGFWLSPAILAMEPNPEATWDVRAIVSGHNNYIDLMLTYGVPGGLMVGYILLVRPLLQYIEASRSAANRNLADLFAMILIFVSYVSLLESFLLNRADPLWLITALAILGLHLAAKGIAARA